MNFEINENGVVINAPEIQFGVINEHRAVARISYAEIDGLWYYALSMNLPYEGQCSPLSKRCDFRNTMEGAIDAGKQAAMDWLYKRIHSGTLLESHEALARDTVLEIEASFQLSLF